MRGGSGYRSGSGRRRKSDPPLVERRPIASQPRKSEVFGMARCSAGQYQVRNAIGGGCCSRAVPKAAFAEGTLVTKDLHPAWVDDGARTRSGWRRATTISQRQRAIATSPSHTTARRRQSLFEAAQIGPEGRTPANVRRNAHPHEDGSRGRTTEHVSKKRRRSQEPK